MAVKRVGLPKSLRFEVFKRDSFSCQYCGQSAPDVILECDHIVPVAEGGQNEMLNLVTSCRDCNRGKGKTRLDDKKAVSMQKAQLDELNIKREQMEMMLVWKTELTELESAQARAIGQYIESETHWGLNDLGERDVRKLIRRFGFEEVFNATQIAYDKYYNGSDASWNRAFSKIGGVCYNKKHGRTFGGE